MRSLASIRRDVTSRFYAIAIRAISKGLGDPERAPWILAAARDAIGALIPDADPSEVIARWLVSILPKTPKLLGSSHKVELGETLGTLQGPDGPDDQRDGVSTAILYMSPGDESGLEMCAGSLARGGETGRDSACRRLCLGHSAGQLAMPHGARSRLWKTALFAGAPALWEELISAEIAAHERAADRAGMLPAVRVDGSTDTGRGAALARRFPRIAFYDYTKMSGRALNHASGAYSPNYHVTLSWSGENEAACRLALSKGANVAVPFDAKPARNSRPGGPIPAAFLGAPVIDGDVSDARFLDSRRGVVVGLRFKAAADRSGRIASALGGFVQPVTVASADAA